MVNIYLLYHVLGNDEPMLALIKLPFQRIYTWLHIGS